MNRPYFQQTEQQRADQQFRKQRRGLSSAEEIVTLILRRYGLDTELEDDANESVALQTEMPVVAPVVHPEPVSLQQQSFCWD